MCSSDLAATTLGGITGAGVTASTVQALGAPTLMLISVALLELGVFGARQLNRAAEQKLDTAAALAEQPIGGTVMAGLTNALKSPYLLNICIYMLLYTVLSTFLYFQQAEIVDRTFADRGARTAFFAQVDLLVNVLTLGGQMFVTARVLQ